MINNDIDNEFQKLQEAYGSHLAEKMNEIEYAYNQLIGKWDSQNFIAFSSLIHKLNGSAGIYGYTEIGAIAAKVEIILSHYDHDIKATEQAINEIHQHIAELKEAVQTVKIGSPALVIKKIDTSAVYLLNSNEDFSFGKNWSTNLTKQLDTFGYKLSVFKDMNALFTALNENHPLTIIISLDLILNPFVVNLNNANIKEALMSCFRNHYTLFFSKSGEIERRLDVVRMNGKGFFLLPFEVSELTSELDNLKRLWEEKFKVIIVDDDKEILNYHSKILTDAGIECRAISSYKEIEKALHEFKADLLLFDVNMEGCSGIELASIIRQQKNYEYIPIIYLSTEENKNAQVKALNVGADDFITKGTDPNIIIEKIRIRASRYKKIMTLAAKNSLTGAFNFEYITKEMDRYIRSTKNPAAKLTIAILKIENLNMISQSYGYYAADQLIVSLYIFLANNLDFSRIIGHYSNNQCIIVFPDTTKEKAEEEIKKLQDKFSPLLHYADGKAFMSSFKAVVATYQGTDPIKKFIEVTALSL